MCVCLGVCASDYTVALTVCLRGAVPAGGVVVTIHGQGEVPLEDFGVGINSSSSFSESSLKLIMAALSLSLSGRKKVHNLNSSS